MAARACRRRRLGQLNRIDIMIMTASGGPGSGAILMARPDNAHRGASGPRAESLERDVLRNLEPRKMLASGLDFGRRKSERGRIMPPAAVGSFAYIKSSAIRLIVAC